MLLLFTFLCKLYKKKYKDGLRVKMTRKANTAEIKVTDLFSHHRMLQCFSSVLDQSVAELIKANQVVFFSDYCESQIIKS